MRIDIGEIENPVAVISSLRACAFSVELDCAVPEDWSQPNRVDSQVTEIVKLRVDSSKVSSMEKVAICGIKPAYFWVGRSSTPGVIAWVPVAESIRQHQINDITQVRRTNAREKKRFLSRCDRACKDNDDEEPDNSHDRV